jgi:membrane glycosyltransferase
LWSASRSFCRRPTSGRSIFSRDFRLFPSWPRFDPERALWLFALTMAFSSRPKIFGLVLMLVDGAKRRAAGGGIRLTISALIEMVLSALMAPILMLIQSGSVFQILVGGDTGVEPAAAGRRLHPAPGHRAPPSLALRSRGRDRALAFLIATSLFLWMSPTILGLVLAIPLSWAVGVPCGRARAQAPGALANP